MINVQAFLGQDIGAAAKATRTVLDSLLAREDVSFADWVTLRTLAQQGTPVWREFLTQYLGENVNLDPGATARLLDGLATRGQIRVVVDADGPEGARVSLTEAGETLYGRLQDEVARVTGQLYGDLDPDEIDVARRVLRQVAERARAAA